MKRILFLAVLGATSLSLQAQPLDRTPLAAVTVEGDKVLLHPNGRWEFADAAKAAAAKKTAELYPENKVRPVDAQGGWLPGSRVIMPGDPDYNRGSLNPKMR